MLTTKAHHAKSAGAAFALLLVATSACVQDRADETPVAPADASRVDAGTSGFGGSGGEADASGGSGGATGGTAGASGAAGHAGAPDGGIAGSAGACTTGVAESTAATCSDECDNDGSGKRDCDDVNCCAARSDCEDATFCGQVPAGNPWEGDLQIDDDLLETLDPTTLPSGANPCRPPQLVLVGYAIDGDTLFVMKEPEGEILPHVRVIGVDTPESAHAGTPAECYAGHATGFTSQLEGHLAWLTFDAECEDIYGRLLAYVYVGPGTQDSLERQLLRRGLATAYPVRKNRTFEKLFEADERQAADAKVGMWGNCP